MAARDQARRLPHHRPRRDRLEVRKATLASIVAKAPPGIRFNEADGPTLIADACKPRRHRLEAQGFRLPFRPLARLAQNEKLGCAGREARGGRGLGQMTRTHSLARERWGEK